MYFPEVMGFAKSNYLVHMYYLNLQKYILLNLYISIFSFGRPIRHANLSETRPLEQRALLVRGEDPLNLAAIIVDNVEGRTPQEKILNHKLVGLQLVGATPGRFTRWDRPHRVK